jgi:hypothetical protein
MFMFLLKVPEHVYDSLLFNLLLGFVFGLVFSFLLGLVFLFFMLADWLLSPWQLWNTQNLIIGSSLNSFQVDFNCKYEVILRTYKDNC